MSKKAVFVRKRCRNINISGCSVARTYTGWGNFSIFNSPVCLWIVGIAPRGIPYKQWVHSNSTQKCLLTQLGLKSLYDFPTNKQGKLDSSKNPTSNYDTVVFMCIHYLNMIIPIWPESSITLGFQMQIQSLTFSYQYKVLININTAVECRCGDLTATSCFRASVGYSIGCNLPLWGNGT